MRLHALVLLLLLLVVRASVAEADIQTTAVTKAELPTGVTVRGTFESGVKFTDKNGMNYLLFSRTFDKKHNFWTLYVDGWSIRDKGTPKSRVQVRDFTERGCPFDPGGLFHDAARTVTDLDDDGFAEVTFAYQIACRSDVSPSTYKLLVFENGKKYILRGETRVDPGDGVLVGGTFKADPAEAKWPAAFLAHAKKTWTATMKDLEITN